VVKTVNGDGSDTILAGLVVAMLMLTELTFFVSTGGAAKQTVAKKERLAIDDFVMLDWVGL
jgi:hypothetical protein